MIKSKIKKKTLIQFIQHSAAHQSCASKMNFIKILLISIVVTQAVAFDVNCDSGLDKRRMEQNTFVLSGLGQYFYVHSVYISDKGLNNSSDLRDFDQKKLKTPMVIKYTFDFKFLDLSVNRYNGDVQKQMLFDLHELQLGLEFNDLPCISKMSNFGFFVMTPKAVNKEKFGFIVLHGCKSHVNQLGRMYMQKVVILITQNNIHELDEPIDIMMKQNYEMNQIEYHEFANNLSFCMCDTLVYYLNDCYANTSHNDEKVGSYWPVVVVAIMIIFIVSSAFILESLSKITD